MTRVAERKRPEVDVLIGTMQINAILDLKEHRDADKLEAVLEKFDIHCIGADEKGHKKWSKNRIVAQKDELALAFEASEAGLDFERIEQILVKASERQSEQAIAGLKGYMDTVLNDIDERLEKVLNCVQAMVRLQGELKDEVATMSRAVGQMVTSVNSHNSAMKKDLVAELRGLGSQVDRGFGAVAEGVDAIRDQFRELIREVKA
jgi:hypothetical protein